MSQPDPSHPGAASSTLNAGSARPAWRAALPAFLLAVVLILVLYRDTAIAMVTIWYRSETFAHAFVVPPIVLWLVWRRRQELASLIPKPALWVLFPVAGVALLWLLGDLVVANSVTQLAFTALLVLTVPAVLGLSVTRVIAFPLAFLFFAVPIGEFLMPQLMESTADFTVIALRLSGIPVYREGLQFVIPSGNWSVVEACSGVRYLIASLTVGTLFAYLSYQSTKRRILFVMVSIAVPVVANWVRAYMIVMVGHLSGNKLAVGVDHLIYGWVFFGVVIMLMFAVGARWSEPEPPMRLGSASTPQNLTTRSFSKLWSVTACLMLIVAMPVAIAKWSLANSGPSGALSLAAPAVLAPGWHLDGAMPIGFKPDFKNPSAEINTLYGNAGKVVGVYLGYYRDQDYERKLVSSANTLVASNSLAWSRVGGGTRDVVFDQQHATVRTAELRRLSVAAPEQGDRLVVWQIFWINGTLTSSDYLAKVYSAVYQLIGRGDDSAVIAVYTQNDRLDSAEGTLGAFLIANYGAIDGLLRQARGNR